MSEPKTERQPERRNRKGYPAWPEARAGLEREIERLGAEVAEELRCELRGEVRPHLSGKRLLFQYIRLAYLWELLGEWEISLQVLAEGEEALRETMHKPGAEWDRARATLRAKLAEEAGTQ